MLFTSSAQQEGVAMKQSVGILAYGSLLSDPGPEIGPLIRSKKEATTPFAVEFARESRERDGAPTLVPVAHGGANVSATILIVEASVEDARDMLYRREINNFDPKKRYKPHRKRGPNTVMVEERSDFFGVDVVLYTDINATIGNPTPETLATLAIESAKTLDDGRDGISYLMNAKAHGIKTALSDAYEDEIKKRLGASDLNEALKKIAAFRKPREKGF
jgi:hypothetical protein